MERPRIGITTKAGGATHPAYRLYSAAVEAAGGDPVWLDPETRIKVRVEVLPEPPPEPPPTKSTSRKRGGR